MRPIPDIVALYVTGLGVPDSVDGTPAWPSTNCMALGDYWAAVNSSASPATALTSNDGLVLQSTLFPSGEIQPCIKSTDNLAVSIGGVAGVVKFAGWVSGSIAGLYQINVQLPVSTATFTDVNGVTGAASSTALNLPVVVTTAAGKSSQLSGVSMWVVQGLLVGSSGATTGAHGSVWAGTTVTAADGATPYAFAVTTGTLPAGLTLDAAAGTIAGTPTTAGTSTVVITVTDNNGVTGTVSIRFVIT